jgi:hypothetical protein
VSLLSYAERQAHWEWCREFIDREVIYRADETHPDQGAKYNRSCFGFRAAEVTSKSGLYLLTDPGQFDILVFGPG